MLKKLRLIADAIADLPHPVRQWLSFSQQQSEPANFAVLPDSVSQVEHTACDPEQVAACLASLMRSRDVRAHNFLEWGCGVATVTGTASLLGLHATGIEIEPKLCEEAHRRLAAWDINAEIYQGNFLPLGSEHLAIAEDPMVSRKHRDFDAMAGQQLERAGIVFTYSWPGEEHFLKLVFDRFAQPATLLLLYRGPNQLELYRKMA